MEKELPVIRSVPERLSQSRTWRANGCISYTIIAPATNVADVTIFNTEVLTPGDERVFSGDLLMMRDDEVPINIQAGDQVIIYRTILKGYKKINC